MVPEKSDVWLLVRVSQAFLSFSEVDKMGHRLSVIGLLYFLFMRISMVCHSVAWLCHALRVSPAVTRLTGYRLPHVYVANGVFRLELLCIGAKELNETQRNTEEVSKKVFQEAHDIPRHGSADLPKHKLWPHDENYS